MPNDFDSKAATDEELVEVIQTRQAELSHVCFQELYLRYFKLLHSFITARIPAQASAEDLSQEVWFRVWKRAETFKEGNVRAWLYTIARNLIIDLSRIKRPVSLVDAEQVAITDCDRFAEECLAERIAKFRSCLDKLDEERSQIVKARLDNMDYLEISERWGIPYNTAQTRFHRAKAQLQECIERQST